MSNPAWTRLENAGVSCLGEGPVWSQEQQRLFWVDIDAGEIHAYDPLTEQRQTWQTGQKVGAAVFRSKGAAALQAGAASGEGNTGTAAGAGMTLAMQNGFYHFDSVSESLTFIADPESHLPGNRFNDGKCDAAGRFFAGSIANQTGGGALYRLDTDGSVHKVIDQVTISNGIAFSADNQTMYFIDTPTRKVLAYDYDLSTGELGSSRVAVQFAEDKSEGNPDGMTIDAEGMLWIAHWGGWQVSRWDPSTGQKIASIPLPVSQVTSCAFGGKDLDTLYITSAYTFLQPEQRAKEPLAGSVFAVKPGVSGTAAQAYGG